MSIPSSRLDALERAFARIGRVVQQKYEIVGLLGIGGMAEVYAAIHRNGHPVAIKFLLARHADDADMRRLFSREAYVANQVKHAGAVPVLDDDVDETGCAFLIMPLLEGETLRDRWKRCSARLPLTEVGVWMADVLDVLASAHASGIVHRDIKPENLFVTTKGDVRVLDFGIARRVHGEGTNTAPAGGVIGTPAFMPPEQAIGDRDATGPHSDCWAVGATIFTLLSGELVHVADSAPAQFVAAATKPARSLADACPGLPRSIVRFVDKALAFKPEDRWRTATEMHAALVDAFEEAWGESMVTVAGRVRTQLAHGDPVSVPAPASRSVFRDRGRLARGAAVVAIAGALLFGLGHHAMTRSSNAATANAASAASAASASAARKGCTTNAACMKEDAAGHFVCRRSDGTCQPLEAPGCTILADRGDVENDATIWLGVILPTTGKHATEWGLDAVRTVDLARRDFVQIARGIPSPRPGEPARPIAAVVCDEAVAPGDVAQHLVDLNVPAVIGFNSSQEVINLATSLFIPHGVLSVATTSQSTLLAAIPHAPGAPRLVWRTTSNTAASVAGSCEVIAQVFEPRLRATGVLRQGEPMRVAHLTSRDTGGLGRSSAVLKSLRFNGKSVLENGSNFREVVYSSQSDPDQIPPSSVIESLLEFRPHVVLGPFFDDENTKSILVPLEAKWPRSERFRPRYVVRTFGGDDFFEFLGKDVERRRRFVGLHTPTSTLVNANLTMHYSKTYSRKARRSEVQSTTYDAMYLLAYAAYAVGDRPITGENLARAIARLIPPGEPIDVGPNGIFDAFRALQDGKSIDLQGAATSLDFDLATGDPPTDLALACAALDETGVAFETIEPGPIFRAATKKIEGLPLRCP